MSQHQQAESGLSLRVSAEREGSNSQMMIGVPPPLATATSRARTSKRPRSEDTHDPAVAVGGGAGDGAAGEDVVGVRREVEEDAGSPRARVVVNVDDSEEDETGGGGSREGVGVRTQGQKGKPGEPQIRRAITVSSDTVATATNVGGGTPSIRVPSVTCSSTEPAAAAVGGGGGRAMMANSNTRCATEVVFAGSAATEESQLSLSCNASQPPAAVACVAPVTGSTLSTALHTNEGLGAGVATAAAAGGGAAVATATTAATRAAAATTMSAGKRTSINVAAAAAGTTFGLDSPPPRAAGSAGTNVPNASEQTTAAPFSSTANSAAGSAAATATATAASTLAKGLSRKELKQRTLDAYQPPPPIDVLLRKEIEEKTIKIELLQQRVASLESEVGQKSALIKLQEERLVEHQGRELKYREALCTVMQDLATSTRRDARRQQHALHFELGHVITTTSNNGAFGSHLKELWVEGNRFREYIREQEQLATRETELDGERTALEKRLQALRRAGGTVAAITESLLKVDSTASVPTSSAATATAASTGSLSVGEGGGASAVVVAGGSSSTAGVLGNFSTTTASSGTAAMGAAFGGGGVMPNLGFATGGGSFTPSSSTTASTTRQSAIMDEAIDVEDRLQSVRREAEAIAAAKEALKAKQLSLESEKKVFLKEIRRISEEDASEFATQALMGRGRYVMLTLLGKGGFSEVWRAFDLQEAQYVACKIHRVGREMSSAQKHHYVRHAHRELEILRRLDHPRVTRLLDVFEPENTTDTFVAVMEYCGGTDLDTFLKSRGVLRELDAKTIMVQIISALRHMADQPTPVIHYDLKPANILFVSPSPLNLEIKVTDFGLSKIMSSAQEAAMNSRHAEGIELTSQGTGTYWYLPPECFDTSRTPIVNGKVDVWAAGIIFYQMLYGRRPFAEGISQRQIWQDKLIAQLAQKPLEFPTTSTSGAPFKVSEDAKAVIQRCLTPSVVDRCDIYQLSADPYFRKLGRTSKALAVLRNSATNAAATASAASSENHHNANLHGMPAPLPRP